MEVLQETKATNWSKISKTYRLKKKRNELEHYVDEFIINKNKQEIIDNLMLQKFWVKKNK